MRPEDVIIPKLDDVIKRANSIKAELDRFTELLHGHGPHLIHEHARVRSSLNYYLKNTNMPNFSVVSFDRYCYRAELWISALKWNEPKE